METFRITDYGVETESEKIQTEAIQRVIELCKNVGGGEIIIPKGNYLVGSLRLYSHMTLHLLDGACLLGSKNKKDYTDFHVPSTLGYLNDEYYIRSWNLPPYYIYGIFCAFGEEEISIIAEKGAVIDGQDCFDEDGEEGFRGPMGMIFSQCKRILLEGYTFQNSANWSHQLDSCEDVEIRNVIIRAGHDGFNVLHCSRVKISDCRIESGDDCFAGYDVRDLCVSSCYVNTACNSLRLGGTKIRFENCVFEGPGHYLHLSEKTYYTHSIFKYYSIRSDVILQDAGDITFSNCSIHGANCLLSYQFRKAGLHQDNRPLRSLTFEHVRISGILQTSYFRGNGQSCKLIFRDCKIQFDGEKVPFLSIDESIELVIERTTCENVRIERR